MRLDKFLSNAGVGSRSQVKILIKKGQVCVNDVKARSGDDIIDENADVVMCQGKRISLEKYRYFMLNKPAGVVSATEDNLDKTVLDCLSKEDARDMFPVGRLDKDTTGLMLLTNDGEFTNSIIHPSKHVSKTYEVVTKIKPSRAGLAELRKGIVLDGIKTIPAIVENPKIIENGFLTKITIFEGRNHQVKNMFSAIGCKVYDLKRIAIGKLELGDLPKGKYKILTKKDLEKIFK